MKDLEQYRRYQTLHTVQRTMIIVHVNVSNVFNVQCMKHVHYSVQCTDCVHDVFTHNLEVNKGLII